MRKIGSLTLLIFCCFILQAQKDEYITVKDIETDSVYRLKLKDVVSGFENVKEKKNVDLIYWKKVNKIGLNISEAAFVNWNSGGTNAISGLMSAEFVRNFKKDFTVWNNRFVTRFGISRQSDLGVRKTTDLIDFNSTFGYRKTTVSSWYTSGNISFQTQFDHGYIYRGDERTIISSFMAPAYLLVGIGTIYSDEVESFTAYISPLTLKSTFVLNQRLANLGAYGVEPANYDADGNLITEGKRARKEVGALFKSTFKKEIYKNVTFENIMSFYSDYINKFGNVDVDWEFELDFKVNNFITANVGSHLKYDDDIKITKKIDGVTTQISGAKVQWKQLLGVGVVYDF